MGGNNNGICILCGIPTKYNLDNPYCTLCGGVCSGCSRSSPSFNSAMFCHNCGEPDYISFENPLCNDCKKS